ncbi:MAG: hypothetical protein WAW69_04385 [Polaromonas sp.]
MRADQHPTAQQLCAVAGISLRNGCDELNDLVKSGEVSINLALEVAQFDHAGQRFILAEFPAIKPRDCAGFVAPARLGHEQEQTNGERS